LPWHLLESIQKRETDWIKRGGKMIVPLPDPRVLTYDGGATTKMLVTKKRMVATK